MQMNAQAVPIQKYQAALRYLPPIREGTMQTDGGLKKRVCLVDPSLDRIGKYLVTGENISAGGWWAWVREKCLSRWYFCVILDQQKILLKADSALARLGLNAQEIEKARKADSTHHNHEAISLLIKTALAQVERDLQDNPQVTFDATCIRSLPLNEVEFLGAHNACLTEEEGWIYNQQHWSFLKQLDAGVRVIELDIAADRHGILQICHGTAHIIDPLKSGSYQTCAEKLLELKHWLETNPHEILVVKLDNSRDSQSNMDAIDHVIEEVGLERFMYTPQDLATRDSLNRANEWPTVAEMIDSGKRLMMSNAKLNRNKESVYTHFEGNVLEEIGLDSPTPAFKSRKVGNETSKYSPRTHKLRFLRYSTEISNETLVKLLKIVSPLLYCIQPLASCFTNKLNVEKITKDIMDSSPQVVDQMVDTLEKQSGARPMVPLMDFDEAYIFNGGLAGINERNRKKTQNSG